MWTGMRIVRALSASARDRLANPPGRVGRELVATPPVELLDRPDQAQRALLNQVEEREALVAVVLRDRDDQAQVRLDHPLLRLHVAALDFLGELDLLRGGQQRMAAGLAQEELQCVGRRLERRRRGWGSRLGARVLDNVDPPLLEHPVDSVDLERGESVRLEHLEKLGRVDGTRDLGGLEELDDLLGLDDAVDRGYRCFQHVSGMGTRPRERFKQVLYKMSSVRTRELDRNPVSSCRCRDRQRSWSGAALRLAAAPARSALAELQVPTWQNSRSR